MSRKSLELNKSLLLKFQKWKDENNINSNSEATMLDYFQHLAKYLKPPSLYAIYSRLKKSLLERENINMGDYEELKTYLSKCHKDYKYLPAMEKLRIEEIDQFIKLAPDESYLACKAMVVLTMCAKCTPTNLYQLKISDIVMRDNNAIISVTNSRNILNKYIISDEYFKIFEKYMEERRKISDLSNLFLRYSLGQFLKQSTGVHKLRTVASDVAKFLKLPNYKKYTYQSLQRMEPILWNLDSQSMVTEKHRQFNINVIDCNPNAIMCTQNGNFLFNQVRTKVRNELVCPIPNVRITNSTNISFNFS